MIRSIRHTLLRRQEMFPVAIIGGSRTWSSFVTTSTTGRTATAATATTVKRILSRPRQIITSTAYINRNYFTGTSTNGSSSSSSCCCCCAPPSQPTSDSSRPTIVFHRTYHSPFPVSILPPPQQQQQQQRPQQQQQRHFGKGLQQRKHGKKHGYTNDETKLQICYSDYDLQLDEEEDDFDEELHDMTFVKVKFHLSNIKETVEEIFDDSRQLQYYDGLKKQWRPLTDLSTIHMQQYRGGKQVLKVRVPEHYDDTPMGKERDDDNDDETFRRFNIDSDDDDEEEDDGYGDDDGTKKRKREQKRKNKMHRLLRADALQIDFAAMFLEGMIKGLVTKLKTAHYVRCNGIIYGENNLKINVYSMIHTETNEKILTKDYVLQEASTNRDLSRLLLAVSGSLDHIVRCIHYNLLWEHQDRPKRMHNGAIIRNE